MTTRAILTKFVRTKAEELGVVLVDRNGDPELEMDRDVDRFHYTLRTKDAPYLFVVGFVDAQTLARGPKGWIEIDYEIDELARALKATSAPAEIGAL